MVEPGTCTEAQEKKPLPKRIKGLRKLGVSEDDVATAERILSEIPPPPQIRLHTSSKVEILLGYSKSRLRREKALKVLGAKEEEVDQENAKALGSLGLSGRRRSYMSNENDKFLLLRQRRRGSYDNKGVVPWLRKHKAELRKIRKDMTAQQKEIESLKYQLEILQDELQDVKLR
jgi:hypothetical protein